MKIKGIAKRIVIVKTKFNTTCAGEGCNQIIEKGAPCWARLPGKERFCSSCAAKYPGWPSIEKSTFVDPLKASKQSAGKPIKRKRRDEEVKGQ